MIDIYAIAMAGGVILAGTFGLLVAAGIWAHVYEKVTKKFG